MKGIILAGGTGTRLRPLTTVTNKHLLPVGRYSMIYHAVDKLARADVTDILIVTGTEHMGDIVSVLGSGKAYGLEFTYRVQDNPRGIADALYLARDFVGRDLSTVILGDNIFEADLGPHIRAFKNQGAGAMLLLKEVDDPGRFGVATLDPARRNIVRIEEKPAAPASRLVATGVYFYDAQIFEYIPTLRLSARREYEITDVNQRYMEHQALSYRILEGWWTDAGTFASWKTANVLTWDLTLPTFASAREQ